MFRSMSLPGRSRSATQIRVKKRSRRNAWTFRPIWQMVSFLNLLKNIRPDAAETKVSYVATTPKPRLVKLSIVPRGDDGFSVVGAQYKATLFVVKVELGGITGLIAPLVG